MIPQRFKFLTQAPIAKKMIGAVRDICPPLPHNVGLARYQKASYWALDRQHCPCDIDLVEYLQQSQTENRTIFHFGTGGHHILGLENQKFTQPNEIIGITASVPEHRSYTELVMKDKSLTKHYKVLFADIYALNSKTLPNFDVVTLFHLCEFYMPENAENIHQDDSSLLQLFLDKLNPGGRLIFYPGSFAWIWAEPIVRAFESSGKIKQVDRYKTLLIYQWAQDR